MVTIKDVASAAGVSATTVSNVIHGYNNRVSKATTEKILKVIEEMEYIPNMSARSLVSRSSHVIAMISYLPFENMKSIIADPFYLRAIMMVERSLRESGYYLMVRSCSSKRELVTFLQNWNADGLFVFGVIDQEFAEALSKSGKPVLLLDTTHPDINLSYVLQDDYQAGCLAASYLLKQGHTKIGYSMSASGDIGGSERMRGFRETLEKAGHPLEESLVFTSISHAPDSIIGLTDPVFYAVRAGMTALASTDIQAILLISSLKKKGLHIPQDLSIIGYGDLPQGVWCDPELTTIHYSIEEKTSLVVSTMLDMLSSESTPLTQITLPVSIVKRASVLPLHK